MWLRLWDLQNSWSILAIPPLFEVWWRVCHTYTNTCYIFDCFNNLFGQYNIFMKASNIVEHLGLDKKALKLSTLYLIEALGSKLFKVFWISDATLPVSYESIPGIGYKYFWVRHQSPNMYDNLLYGPSAFRIHLLWQNWFFAFCLPWKELQVLTSPG